jgi:ADP-heptose:LPS heptosyltransferase
VVLTDDERSHAREVLADGRQGAVLLMPGAGMPVKRWPSERWRVLSDLLRGRDLPVYSVGEDELPGAMPLPSLSLRQLAAVAAELGRAGGVAVGGDTGPVRLATAVGLPAAGLYGPTLAARYGLSDAASTNIQGLPGCEVRRPAAITEQECWWSARCPLTADGQAGCMADLGVEQVADAIVAMRAGIVGSGRGRT